MQRVWLQQLQKRAPRECLERELQKALRELELRKAQRALKASSVAGATEAVGTPARDRPPSMEFPAPLATEVHKSLAQEAPPT